jgi:exopolyphosphatase/guanosine-5'-triphosphate,3'-diphosphate pyrophosphatase
MTENTQAADNNNQTYAAIDLGSNSFHMIVCRISDGELLIEDRLRETVSLGSGLDKKRNLTPEIQERALACLEGFGQRLRNIPSENVRSVGTNTLRSAKNSREFLQKANVALGHRIEIISGVEEARLIYLGVAQGISTDGERRLVMDIGGGSTELIIGSGFTPIYMQSLYMGCVTFSQRFFSDGSITAKNFKRAEIAARMELEPVQSVFLKLGWENAIGASGSIRSIRSVVREAQWSDEGITMASLKNLRDALIEMGNIDNVDLKGLSAERKPVFLGGVVILLAAFKALGIERMQVSDSALREGLVQELLGPVQHQQDVRSNAVINLARRYHADETQAQLVKETALECARQVAADWKLNLDETNKWLEWAAQLHEIGLDISHSQYHKHGAYIAEHVDLAGFSRQEQQVLAALIGNHRRKIAKDYLKRLADYRYQPTLYWTILLRLAVLLHRSRATDPLPAFTLKSKKKSLQIQFPDEWLDSHALTRGDLEQEAGYLAAMDFTLAYS